MAKTPKKPAKVPAKRVSRVKAMKKSSKADRGDLYYTADKYRDMLEAAILLRGLSRPEVARICRVSVNIVNAWLKPPTVRSSSRPTAMAVELLYLKLGLPLPATYLADFITEEPEPDWTTHDGLHKRVQQAKQAK